MFCSLEGQSFLWNDRFFHSHTHSRFFSFYSLFSFLSHLHTLNGAGMHSLFWDSNLKHVFFHLYLRIFLVFQPSLEHIKGETSFFIFTILSTILFLFPLKNNTPLFQGKLNVWKCYFDCFRNKITILTTCFKMIYSKGSSTSESRFHS